MSGYVQSGQDLMDLAESVARHATAWQGRDTSTREGASAAYAELAHAVGAIDRLVSSAEALKAPLAEALVAHQTDQADALGEFFSEVVGDREYGINPEGGQS
ncbi:hypothetical protein [Glycomyces tenuis]|uniref:hypothetical protein n=1 Tax=Glycomyces tenuis TaxID=58116 RepID=UPI0012DF7603|nr:hypothetical protein [Glycomyces tenuis]